MGKKDSKHDRKKKSSRKKHKKEKKSKRHKKRSESSDSADSDTSTDSRYFEAKEGKSFPKPVSECFSNREDESNWDILFSDRHTITKEKNVQKKNRDILCKPGQSARELNPYWKDGGTGLPPSEEQVLLKSNQDVKYLKNLLQKARDTSDVTGVPVEDIIEEEWGSLKKLRQIIGGSENDASRNEISERKAMLFPLGPNSSSIKCISSEGGSERRRHFMKPGELSSSEIKNTYRQNWKKKDVKKEELPSEMETPKKIEKEIVEKKILTPDELNALVAEEMKAEIMGNKELSEKLKKEIEIAKKYREEMLAKGECKAGKKKEEIVLMINSNSKGVTRPFHNHHSSERSSKRQKVETHKHNERIRYFVDDDKHSLESMFEKEKLSTSEQSNEIFLKMMKKRKAHGDDDFDDDFLDKVRNSDYERKEREKESRRAVNEARAKHKSWSNCRWCLDGNNIQKHLIISVGSKCYLCLPSDESLTNGHCLIVPVHHDTCGTSLDEDVWNEMQLYRKNICKMFEESGQDVVFFENARSFHRYPHMVLNCVPIDKEIGDLAPIYFKKAIMESETEWSNNKKVVDLRNKDLRRSIPKGLPYFAVDFGMDGGFAHVIEDEKLFPFNFAEEIIGGMLDLDYHKWRKKRKESFECQKEKVTEFMEKWKDYDFSEAVKTGRPGSDSSSSD